MSDNYIRDEATRVAAIAHWGFDRLPELSPEQAKHVGHRVIAVFPHIWFCRDCVEQFDGELDAAPELDVPVPGFREQMENAAAHHECPEKRVKGRCGHAVHD